ncbi:helix-turn-helix domain-containing protein [Xylanimonas protaetiae]|uniref:Helix-turn-helix domain-containing protein n=1 Tax=Xylanimonas protaetiae TaxID=2509457 RepID=A0A4P6F1E7_9MICO|nr:helix-turn-helix domain-containing protein [Xylanimonas protaetiae]QAY69312.1 helix-turn-helix domain-containing protein [Xylanimonas protaetiae]
MPTPAAVRLHERPVAAHLRPLPARDPSRAALRARVLEVIAAEAANPHLTPADVAAALGITDRTLARLFEHAPRSVAGHIAQARLDLALEHLDDARFSGDLDVVARRSGYSSVADLDRAVLASTGLTPADHQTDADDEPPVAGPRRGYRPTLPRGRRARDVVALLR